MRFENVSTSQKSKNCKKLIVIQRGRGEERAERIVNALQEVSFEAKDFTELVPSMKDCGRDLTKCAKWYSEEDGSAKPGAKV